MLLYMFFVICIIVGLMVVIVMGGGIMFVNGLGWKLGGIRVIV